MATDSQLKHYMVRGGFALREVPSSGAFSYYFARQFALPHTESAGHIVVRVGRSSTTPGAYMFDTSLLWNGEMLPTDMQIPPFVGSVYDFLNTRASIFGTLIEVHDFRMEVSNEFTGND